MDGDSIYFGRRAQEEREAALKSSNAQARRSHLELAERYADLASTIDSHGLRLSFPSSR